MAESEKSKKDSPAKTLADPRVSDEVRRRLEQNQHTPPPPSTLEQANPFAQDNASPFARRPNPRGMKTLYTGERPFPEELPLEMEDGDDWDDEDDTVFSGQASQGYQTAPTRDVTPKKSTPPVHRLQMEAPRGHTLEPVAFRPDNSAWEDPFGDDDDDTVFNGPQVSQTPVNAFTPPPASKPAISPNRPFVPPQDPFIGRLLGNFKILEKIGEGGFGAVYKAEQVHLQQFFAVKLLRTMNANAETIERFKREAKALAKIRHENVVQLADFGLLPDSGFYLVMEYAEGKTLKELLASQQKLPLARILPIIEQVCSVLEYVHQLGICHRDLKPDNILLVSEENRSEQVKVIDFGIAAVDEEESELTAQDTYLGSPLYMAPEQGRDEELDARSDLYSLGVVLFEMLTGRPPFEGEALHVLLSKHLFSDPPKLAEIASDVHWGRMMEAFVQRALSKKREQRPQSAKQFWEEFQRAVQAQQRARELPTISDADRMQFTPPANISTHIHTPPSSFATPVLRDTVHAGKLSAESSGMLFPHERDALTNDSLPSPSKKGTNIWLILFVFFFLASVGILAKILFF
ncbi:MAG: hypothetical protein CL932_22295 [Deltaproteobacteria bacterium]|mgnify:CR=1 FL=1|nr:hypothetical protein [Deltaproteobacteria bacterium]